MPDLPSRNPDRLRKGVRAALTTLGTGFLRHPANTALRANADAAALHQALLRLVFRLLFLFVTEDRDTLLSPDATAPARARYAEHFSTARLRADARGSVERDELYAALRAVLDALGDPAGDPGLGLPGLGGIFAPTDADAALHGLALADEDLLSAVRRLSEAPDPVTRRARPVDFGHLEAEELGSVHESLLQLVPRIDPADRAFTLVGLPGNARKTSGSYYTPAALVECLLDAALDPVLDAAVARAGASGAADPGEAAARELLALTVCDPACGSGHFLVAAARRIARRLADVGGPGAQPYRDALREVVARCVHGVDLDPMAVELARMALWLEAPEPGRPLTFLDARVKHGNALIGATPELLRRGVPNAAFIPTTGDDRARARALRKRNRAEREAARGQDVAPGRAAADAWCAAFLWRRAADAPPAVTDAVLRDLPGAPRSTHEEIARLRDQYRFFHWHLEFPGVYGPDGTGGFDCVLGNPPWERIKLQEQEFFAQHDAEIAAARTAAARKRLIAALKEDPERAALHSAFEAAKRTAEGTSHFLRDGGRHPLTGRGDINTYAVFAELGRALTGPRGRMGMIVPTGIATDATTRFYFKDLVDGGALAALYDFENAAPVFPDVHRSFKFSILALTGSALREPAARFAFFLRDPAELHDEGRVFALTPEEIMLLNPNTGTCPVFRTRRDAEITLGIYARLPVLIREGDPDGNPWGVTFGTMFHMANDSHRFRTREELAATGWQAAGNHFVNGDRVMLPLYEAKMVDAYNHRAADVVKSATAVRRQNQPAYLTAEAWASASRLAVPGSWVDRADTPSGTPPGRLAFLRVSSSTNQRTMISAILPPAAIGDSVFLLHTRNAHDSAALVAHFNSFVYDYVTRQKAAGLNLSFFYIRQLPVLPPETVRRHTGFLIPRVLELTCTAHDMTPFAADLGDPGGPFRWDEARRHQIRAELDAFFFHLYRVGRADTAYILDTFPIVRRRDEARYGDYRTKDLVLTAYDQMAASGVTEGGTYTSPLSPPPGDGPRHRCSPGNEPGPRG